MDDISFNKNKLIKINKGTFKYRILSLHCFLISNDYILYFSTTIKKKSIILKLWTLYFGGKRVF